MIPIGGHRSGHDLEWQSSTNEPGPNSMFVAKRSFESDPEDKSLDFGSGNAWSRTMDRCHLISALSIHNIVLHAGQ